MSATVLEIVEKVKIFPVRTADPDNFIVRAGDEIDAQIVIDHPHISLYCIDDQQKQAWFVETPPEVDLSQAPFYYVAQYDHAQRLFAVPYAEFHQLAATVPLAKLIIIHSTGRCGSTLISKALNAVEGVLSLSEPDVYTQISHMRQLDKSRDAEYAALLKSSTRIFCRNMPTVALKFRAMCIQLGDLLYNAFPNATNLFLYREMVSWARSMGAEFRPVAERRLPVQEFPIYRRTMAPLSIPFAAEHGREANSVELAALTWLSLMEKYLALCDAGMPFLALRYEDIRAQPKAVLAAMLDYCGLTGDVDEIYAVFATDSQEGTFFSRTSRQEHQVFPFEAEDFAQMQAVFAARPVIHSPDFIAPHTRRFD